MGPLTQEDPIGLAGGLNLYGYANGDPVNFSDPFGLNPCTISPTPECVERVATYAMESLAGALNRVGNAILTGLAALAMTFSPIDEGAAVVAAGRGLKGASSGLKSLFKAEGGLADGTLIGIRTRLLEDGFSQTLSHNKKGYLFTNDAGEQVRLMAGENGWELRIRNSTGNYLDEMGNPGDRASTHLSMRNR